VWWDTVTTPLVVHSAEGVSRAVVLRGPSSPVRTRALSVVPSSQAPPSEAVLAERLRRRANRARNRVSDWVEHRTACWWWFLTVGAGFGLSDWAQLVEWKHEFRVKLAKRLGYKPTMLDLPHTTNSRPDGLLHQHLVSPEPFNGCDLQELWPHGLVIEGPRVYIDDAREAGRLARYNGRRASEMASIAPARAHLVTTSLGTSVDWHKDIVDDMGDAMAVMAEAMGAPPKRMIRAHDRDDSRGDQRWLFYRGA
jgi:hypothetical protein